LEGKVEISPQSYNESDAPQKAKSVQDPPYGSVIGKHAPSYEDGETDRLRQTRDG